MNEINMRSDNLPANIEDLSKFVLVGREKLVSVRAEIRAIEKVGLAEEVRKQKLEEAQAISEAVLDAEVKIGELMSKVPKNNVGRPPEIIDSAVDNLPSKSEVIEQVGFTQKQAERFQTLAKHPDIVEQAKAEARENDDIVSRSAALKKIEELKHPHVLNNSSDNEWYTPPIYIQSAKAVMGSIDLDPASNELANETVRAETYYTEETDGLSQRWYGNIWLNPPYSSQLVGKFVDKLTHSIFCQAVVHVNNATETSWFKQLVDNADAIVFTTGRIKFLKKDGAKGTPLQGQAFIYFGDKPELFLDEFRKYGWGATL